VTLACRFLAQKESENSALPGFTLPTTTVPTVRTILMSGKPGSMIPFSSPDPQSNFKDASRPAPELYREVFSMPTVKEFTLTMDDRPGTLGKICRALADRNVNIVAAQSFPYASSGKALTRFVFDDPTKARSVLDADRATYTETEVVKVNLPNKSGELARAAQKLGDAGININYLYCGAEPNSNTPVIIFGVAEVGKAAPLVEHAAAAAGGRG
jgi:hypothetical protein